MRAAFFKNRKIWLAATFIIGGLVEPLFAALPALPEDPAGASFWKQRRIQTIQECLEKPPQDAISILGQMARQLETLGYRDCPEKREIQNAALLQLLSIPGHAEYYAKRIKDAQREVDALNPEELAALPLEELEAQGMEGLDPQILKNLTALGPAGHRLSNEQMYGFETLGCMPSPETVRVLGEFLFDPWGLNPNAKPGEPYGKDELGQAPHASYAMLALARLPLETRANATPPEETRYWENIDAWKLWYEQVKAGTRTFRFKGDPQEYSLAGPVSKIVEPGASHQKSSGGSSSPQETLAKPSKIPLVSLIGAITLLMAAIGVAMRKKRSPVAGG